MVVPAFGFAVGDFIAGINLVKSLIEALQDGAGAKPQYLHLINDLINLKHALIEVRDLKVEDCQASQKIALEQVALQCQETIEEFLNENAKFKSTLGSQFTTSRWSWRANLHKIQWAVCKEDAINKLRAQVTSHTLAINILLATVNLSTTALQSQVVKKHRLETQDHRKVMDETQSLVKRNHDLLSAQADLILTISQTVTTCSTHQQTEDLQSIMLRVLSTNVKIYEMILDMQKLQSQLPPQVDRQQPVYFEDAHGRIAPFHVEFINSFDAFQAVMEVRFRHVPGLRKVQNMEYAIYESNSKRKIDLTAPWDSVFLPGRKVNMSMVFQRRQTLMTSCPGCQTENESERSNKGSETQCSNPDCKIWYRRIVEIDSPREPPASAPKMQLRNRSRNTTSSPSRKRSKRKFIDHNGDGAEEAVNIEDEDEDEDEIHQFRRVHVVHKHPALSHQQNSSIVQSIVNASLPREYKGIDPTKLDFCRVLYDYKPVTLVRDIDLEVKRGDLVAVLSKEDPSGEHSDWWHCRTRDGLIGYLPNNYLEIIQRRNGPTMQSLPQKYKGIDPTKLDFCRVLYDYKPVISVRHLDLEVKRGDLVAVLSKEGPSGEHSDWWHCRTRDGLIGYLPNNYLEIISRQSRKPPQHNMDDTTIDYRSIRERG